MMMPSGQFDISLWEQTIAARAREREKLRLRLLATTKERLESYFSNKQVGSVYLAGSILRPGQFYDFSDIDVAVERLGEPYFEVHRELDELLDRKVDVIELEHCRFREGIQTQGIKIK